MKYRFMRKFSSFENAYYLLRFDETLKCWPFVEVFHSEKEGRDYIERMKEIPSVVVLEEFEI